MSFTASSTANLTTKQFSAIGKFIVRWAQLEHKSGSYLIHILNLPKEEGRAVFMPMDVRPKLEIMLLISNVRKGEKSAASKSIRRILRKARDLIEIRNVIVHGTWSRPTNGRQLLLATFKGGSERKHARVGKAHKANATWINGHTAKVGSLIGRLSAWQKKYWP